MQEKNTSRNQITLPITMELYILHIDFVAFQAFLLLLILFVVCVYLILKD